MFMKGVLCTVCGTQVYFSNEDKMLINNGERFPAFELGSFDS